MRMMLPASSIGGSPSSTRSDWFRLLSVKTAYISGHPVTFSLSLGVVLAWALTGPLFKFSDTWQLVINTGTTIVTFLMVFLIQATQNRDTLAIQLKLDELIVATRNAHNETIAAEDKNDHEIERMKADIRDRVDKDL